MSGHDQQTHLSWAIGQSGQKRSKQYFCMVCNKDPLLIWSRLSTQLRYMPNWDLSHNRLPTDGWGTCLTYFIRSLTGFLSRRRAYLSNLSSYVSYFALPTLWQVRRLPKCSEDKPFFPYTKKNWHLTYNMHKLHTTYFISQNMCSQIQICVTYYVLYWSKHVLTNSNLHITNLLALFECIC